MAPDATLKDLFLNGLVHLFPLTLPDQTLAFYTAGRNKRVIKNLQMQSTYFYGKFFVNSLYTCSSTAPYAYTHTV